jgi:hypothetical protein
MDYDTARISAKKKPTRKVVTLLTFANVAPKETLILRSIAKRCVSKDGCAAHPPSLLRNFGATGIGLPSRSPQGEGWFETALKKRLLTMRFPVVAPPDYLIRAGRPKAGAQFAIDRRICAPSQGRRDSLLPAWAIAAHGAGTCSKDEQFRPSPLH